LRRYCFAFGTLIFAIFLATPASADERVLRLAAPNEVETLDPHLHTWAAERIVTTMMLDGLTREDANGEPAPAGAASWDVSADGRRYVFHLRPEARFSDGRPVTAQDFVYAFRRYVDPRTHSRSTSAIESVLHARDCLSGKLPPDALGVEATDSLTLTVTLSHPSPFFLNWATLLVPLEQAVVERWGDAWTEPDHMVSNGPFILSRFQRGGTIELARNPNYWNKDHIQLDRILLVVPPNRDAIQGMFDQGALDAMNLTDDQVMQQRATLGDRLKIQPLNRIAYYVFNLRTGPLAEQADLRRALALTFEPEALARQLSVQTAEPANSLIPRNFPAYAHPRLDFAARAMTDRLAEARRLYAELHYGADRPLVVNMVESSGKRCELVADMWRSALGVQLQCSIIEDDAVRMDAYRRGDFDMGFLVENAAAPDPLELLESFQGVPLNASNVGHYENEAFDDLLHQADGSADFLSRAEKLARAERILLNELPAIPISYGRIAYVVAPRVKGFRVLPSRSLYVDGVTVEGP
jgi:ABC-type oligopeptide transport system substrate-binding subunit